MAYKFVAASPGWVSKDHPHENILTTRKLERFSFFNSQKWVDHLWTRCNGRYSTFHIKLITTDQTNALTLWQSSSLHPPLKQT